MVHTNVEIERKDHLLLGFEVVWDVGKICSNIIYCGVTYYL